MSYVIIIAIVVCIITVGLSRIYVARTFDHIDETLDSIISKKSLLPLSKLRDDRISKLQHKAYRIMDMYVSDAKEVIQGFISDLSHQMKTPLSGVSMYSELLLADDISVCDQKDFATQIKMLSEKLQWMMDCLTKMSRLEMGAIELVPENSDIKKTITVAVENVISAETKKNIDIYLLSLEALSLYHDRKWTVEVLSNVLENAVKYSMPKSDITIGVEQLALYTKILVTDNGIGIAKEDYNHIFKRFYRSKNTKQIEGAGFWIYLASPFMEKQDGYIMVNSEIGKSTTFSLFLQNCKN